MTNKLVKLIEEKGFSKAVFSKALNVSSSTFCNWTRDYRAKTPMLPSQTKIALHLGVSLEYLQSYCGWGIPNNYTKRPDGALKKLVAKKGLSLSGVARVLGVKQERVSTWSSDTSGKPTLENQIKLAKALSTPICELQGICGWPVTDDIKIIKWD